MWDLLWDSSGTHETCVGPHVTRDSHVGLVACGWLDCLVFSLIFNLACSSTFTNLAGGDAGWNPQTSLTSTYLPDSNKNKRIMNLIVLLQVNMPSDLSSPLGAHLNSMMSLRMILLGRARSKEEEELVETFLSCTNHTVLPGGRVRTSHFW